MDAATVRQMMLANIAEIESYPVLYARLSQEQRRLMEANKTTLQEDDAAIVPYLAQVADRYNRPLNKEQTMSKSTDCTLDPRYAKAVAHGTALVSAINWGDLLQKLWQAAPVIYQLLVTALNIFTPPPPAPKAKAKAAFTCPTDHSACCHRTLESSLETALLASECCCHCDDGEC